MGGSGIVEHDAVWRRCVGNPIARCAAVDCDRVAVDRTGVQQRLHDGGDASDGGEVRHHVLAGGLEVGDMRCRLADAGEVFELERHLGLVGDRHQVEHGVRRTAHGRHDRDGVPQRPLVDHLPRPDVGGQRFNHQLTRAVGDVEAVGCGGRRGGPVGHREAERLDGRRHGVRGEHSAAGAGTGARDPLELVEVPE